MKTIYKDTFSRYTFVYKLSAQCSVRCNPMTYCIDGHASIALFVDTINSYEQYTDFCMGMTIVTLY